MARLSVYVPPFASDYTGVCSALFDFDCLVAVNDASCCTGHYVYFDEPRWAEKQRPTFSTQLRNVDAILGNDDKVIRRVVDMTREIGSETVALVGTPVPAITGMDMQGMACEIESITGKPAFGFPTAGVKYYDNGIFLAGQELINRFAEDCPVVPGSVNVLGMTPLDYGNAGNEKTVEEALEEMGFSINARMFMNSSIDDIRRLAAAELNIAVSFAGYKCAKLLRKKFGTPFVAAAPMGKEYFAKAVKAQLSVMSAQSTKDSEAADQKPGTVNPSKKILIVGDQIMSNSLREAMKIKGCRAEISVVGFFGWDRKLAASGDVSLKGERDYIDFLRNGNFDTIISDPMLQKIPAAESIERRFEMVHPAVSGRLGWGEVMHYLSDEFENLIDSFI